MPTGLTSAVSPFRSHQAIGVTVVLAWGLLATPLMAAATPKVALVASSSENLTVRGLTTLGVAHARLSPREFRDFSTMDADLLIWGFDESRQMLAERRDELAAFPDVVRGLTPLP